MTRSRHVSLERTETVVHAARGVDRRRAALEHELEAALAEGDRELVSRVYGELSLLNARRAMDAGRSQT